MIIDARVKTGQPHFSIKKTEGVWKISVRAKPEKNAANIEILMELSKKYGTVKILSGKTSARKKILLDAPF